MDRAIAVLRHIGDGNPCRNLSTTARALDINRTTLIRLIHTLLDQRMIEELGDGLGYRLGVGLATLGAQAIEGRDLVRTCQPVLQTLCEHTNMSAHLGVLDGPDIVYLSRATPNSHLVSNIRIGARLPAQATSIGRAILAQLPAAEVMALFDGQTLAAATAHTPTTMARVLDQAETDAALGYAWSVGNFEAGIGSCGAALMDHSGKVVGGLNVSGPESRFADPDDGAGIRKAVCAAAAEATARLGGG